MTRARAVLFDLDGTLFDNMSFHGRAWVEMARRLGRPDLTSEYFERVTAGLKNSEIFPLVLGRPMEREELARLAEEKEALYREVYRGHVKPVAGLVALLERLEAAGVKRGVATLAPPKNRELVFGETGLDRHFATIVGGERVSRGKPAPDIFLLAARELGVDPKDCLAVEDAVNGVRAAIAAGMPAVGVTTSATEEALRSAGARWTVRDYVRLPADLEAQLFGSAPCANVG